MGMSGSWAVIRRAASLPSISGIWTSAMMMSKSPGPPWKRSSNSRPLPTLSTRAPSRASSSSRITRFMASSSATRMRTPSRRPLRVEPAGAARRAPASLARAKTCRARSGQSRTATWSSQAAPAGSPPTGSASKASRPPAAGRGGTASNPCRSAGARITRASATAKASAAGRVAASMPQRRNSTSSSFMSSRLALSRTLAWVVGAARVPMPDTGSRTRKRMPRPGSPRASMSPPIRSMSRLLMARPRPVPP